MSKPKGRDAKIRKDKETARQTSEFITSLARLVRAVSVLMDSLRGWF